MAAIERGQGAPGRRGARLARQGARSPRAGRSGSAATAPTSTPPGRRSARTAAPSTRSTGRRRPHAEDTEPGRFGDAAADHRPSPMPGPAGAGRPGRTAEPPRVRRAGRRGGRRRARQRRRQARPPGRPGAGLTRCYDRSAMTAAGGADREGPRQGAGACQLALAALREWRPVERPPGSGPARSDHLAAEPAAVPRRRRPLGQRPRHAGADHAGRRPGVQRDPARARARPLRRLHPRRGGSG